MRDQSGCDLVASFVAFLDDLRVGEGGFDQCTGIVDRHPESTTAILVCGARLIRVSDSVFEPL